MRKAIGIYRETNFSGKPELDQRILNLTAEELRKKGFVVEMVIPENFKESIEADLIFTMTRGGINDILLKKEKQGVFVINSPRALKETINRKEAYKEMVASGVNIPEFKVFSTKDISFTDIAHKKIILKPAHRHEFWFVVNNIEDFEGAINEYNIIGAREIIAQDYLDGQHLKYYVIGEDVFLPGIAENYHNRLTDYIREQALLSGQSLGLKIFGGDFIICQDKVFCVDTNDWPTFSVNSNLTQEFCAVKIADLIEREFNDFKIKQHI